MSKAINREGDVVLIYYDDRPSIYARIEMIEADVKKDWYQVSLLILSVPAQEVTWILREEYINGSPFTMGGRPMKIEHVEKQIPEHTAEDRQDTEGDKGQGKPGKVIPFKKQI